MSALSYGQVTVDKLRAEIAELKKALEARPATETFADAKVGQEIGMLKDELRAAQERIAVYQSEADQQQERVVGLMKEIAELHAASSKHRPSTERHEEPEAPHPQRQKTSKR